MNFENIVTLHPEISSIGFYSTDGTWFYVWEDCRPDEDQDLTLAAPWERGELIARFSDKEGYGEAPLAEFC